jgi:hypothetical protein
LSEVSGGPVEAKSRRRHDELLETFQAIDACLACYYAGHVAIYRPLSSQLRLLYCDKSRRRDNSLLTRCFTGLQLQGIKRIERIRATDRSRLDSWGFSLEGTGLEDLWVARMPFTVTTYENGLRVADLDLDDSAPQLMLDRWLDQEVTLHPGLVTIRDVIISVAHKGGGVHVDDDLDRHLLALRQLRPCHLGAHVLFIVAIARFSQGVGARYAQFRERVGYFGDIGALEFDPDHPSASRMAQVEPDVVGRAVHQGGLLMVENLGDKSAENTRLIPRRD